MLFILISLISLTRADFDLSGHPSYNKEVIEMAVQFDRGVLVGVGVDLDDLKARAQREGKLYCEGDRNFSKGVTELFPQKGVLWIKPEKKQEELPQIQQFQQYDCPSCRRFR